MTIHWLMSRSHLMFSKCNVANWIPYFSCPRQNFLPSLLHLHKLQLRPFDQPWCHPWFIAFFFPMSDNSPVISVILFSSVPLIYTQDSILITFLLVYLWSKSSLYLVHSLTKPPPIGLLSLPLIYFNQFLIQQVE